MELGVGSGREMHGSLWELSLLLEVLDILWMNAAVQANLKALVSTGNSSWHFIKTQFYGGFFLSCMWVAKRYPLLKVIFHSSVINAKLTTHLLSWNGFWIHKTEGIKLIKGILNYPLSDSYCNELDGLSCKKLCYNQRQMWECPSMYEEPFFISEACRHMYKQSPNLI